MSSNIEWLRITTTCRDEFEYYSRVFLRYDVFWPADILCVIEIDCVKEIEPFCLIALDCLSYLFPAGNLDRFVEEFSELRKR